MRDEGLTEEEGVVMDALVAAANGFARLPRQHPSELSEFVGAIHRCQGLLAIRLARTTHPVGWPTHPPRDPFEGQHR